ncbi:MAG: aminotransferase class I/II-fold pyridoxal phosphate-dependent enzyme [Candidatus Korobacteraceae bacterium]|jgi:aromatic-L-amino-acid decarboxylase
MQTPKPQAAADAPFAGENWNSYVEDFAKSAHEAVDWIAGYLRQTRRHPVLPAVKPGELIDALPAHAPEQGEPYSALLRDFEQKIMPAVTHWNHPGFMAYFGTTGSAPAILGEMLAAALNTNGLHWKTSPAVAELEQVALGWLREWIGLPPEFFGIIFDTASTSSMHALVAARQFACPEARVEGSARGMTVYTSEQSHSSIEKGAIAIGIGQNYVRKVPVDGEFRMRPDALARLIEDDVRAGHKPMCVVATVGTTSTTSVDPVAEIVEICERHGVWLHIDAAYAGSAAILPEYRHILRGAERAHSLVMNPHKWMLTPIDCSVFYTRYPDIFRQAFSLVPEYLRASEDPRAVHLMDYGVPLGHRFRSLKLWFVMRYFGRQGVERILRSHIAMAQQFAAWVDADARFERVAPVPFSVVCFRYRGTDEQNRRLMEAVNASGKVFLSNTALNGKFVLRVAIGNLGTSSEDVKLVWELLCKAAGKN